MSEGSLIYSMPTEDSDDVYIIDIIPDSYGARHYIDMCEKLGIDLRNHTPGAHMLYRQLWPGSIIHAGSSFEDTKERHTGIKYHLGER